MHSVDTETVVEGGNQVVKVRAEPPKVLTSYQEDPEGPCVSGIAPLA